MLALLGITLSTRAVEVSDSLGRHEFATVPQRVVALNWAAAEHLLELGVTPLAVADTAGYREWVVQPALPAGVEDVGMRQEPNLERLAELKPDLILSGDQQRDLLPRLSQIAPVLHFDSFSSEHNNAEAARRVFLTLARVLDREARAEQRLAALEQGFEQLRARLHAHFGDPLPRVTVVRLMDSSHVRIYGDNGMPQYALERLGIAPALEVPVSQWGQVQKKLTDLGAIRDGVVLYIEPFPEADKLFATPLWRAMPFVRTGRLAAAPSTWTYGGVMSLGYLADNLSQALLSMPKE
ncbi:iron-siderophore ABC transporter substrate-binding protein [Zobellella sp. CGMCC 1.18722]|uniref:Iron-siderophore ABC transporter substrate-binding protein n=1 Tax=Zobellella iuensis TaxID=2803811 RepID=A0ABS1QV03_9GAMM|nr:iron-siderophore ABC transporter substrate-binding protein [Zobellella iuensis]